ncbi:hypothetical protein QJQ45_012735 [Haematococcus lacustris]|nr:hypothetical protein QJQ45_012735 [Haematococcus lacustris]
MVLRGVLVQQQLGNNMPSCLQLLPQRQNLTRPDPSSLLLQQVTLDLQQLQGAQHQLAQDHQHLKGAQQQLALDQQQLKGAQQRLTLDQQQLKGAQQQLALDLEKLQGAQQQQAQALEQLQNSRTGLERSELLLRQHMDACMRRELDLL